MFKDSKNLLEKQAFKKILFVLFLIIFLVMAVFVWYSPVLFKGYAAHSFSANLILARNMAESGVYGMENNLSVVLAPELVASEAHTSNLGNRFTSYAYAAIFKVFGNLNLEQLMFWSCFSHALALFFFMLTVKSRWGRKVSLIFGLVYIFLPIQWTVPFLLGSYEFATLFFAIFVWLYFNKREKKWPNFYLAGTGIFLALAIMAKEAYLLFVPIFLIYLWLTKKRKELVVVGTVFLVVISVFWLPRVLDNVYFGHLTTKGAEEKMGGDLEMYSEFFKDPYAYHFQKEEILANTKIEKNWNPLGQLPTIKLLSNVGLRTPIIYERLVIGTFLFLKHNFKLLSLEQTGGPLVFILLLIGLSFLWQKERKEAWFLGGWILGTSILLGYVVLASRSHLMDIIFPLALLIALGMGAGIKILAEKIKNKKILRTAEIILCGLLIYNFIQTSHLGLNRMYDESSVLEIKTYAQKIAEVKQVKANEVIAVEGIQTAFQLNYMTNKSLVVFQSSTLEKLLNENKLKEVLKEFKVQYLLGYSADLSARVAANTEVIILAPKLAPKEPEPSYFQKMFLNFFR